jgi:hypothetical protein
MFERRLKERKSLRKWTSLQIEENPGAYYREE